MPHKLFPSQQPNEKILLLVREHWFRLLIKFLVIFFLSILPLIVKGLLDVDSSTSLSTKTLLFISLLNQLYYLGLVVAGFIIFILYYLNIHIVSEMRVVDIDQHGLLKHEVSELNIDTIEDVSSETIGFFGNIFDYGTVYVQTAGTTERFEFEKVPHPAKIANIILTLYEKNRKKTPNHP